MLLGLGMVAVLVSAWPTIARSQLRSVRVARAWALGAQLLEDDGVLWQSSRANCGHTLLMMILTREGRPVPRDLADASRAAKLGLTVWELAELARRAGLRAEVARVPVTSVPAMVGQTPVPVIALVGTHYVLIEEPIDERHVLVVDPSVGRMRMPVEVLQREWRGVVVTVSV